MSLRIDLREIDRSFIDNVLTIVKALDCVLMEMERNLFEPTPEKLLDNIKNSNAFKFMINPTDFLDKLGK